MNVVRLIITTTNDFISVGEDKCQFNIEAIVCIVERSFGNMTSTLDFLNSRISDAVLVSTNDELLEKIRFNTEYYEEVIPIKQTFGMVFFLKPSEDFRSINFHERSISMFWNQIPDKISQYNFYEEEFNKFLSKIMLYETFSEEDEDIRDKFLEILKSPECFFREHLPYHVTSSGFVVNADKSKAFILKHKKLGMWLQPGGHNDGCPNSEYVALKECYEETNATSLEIENREIFDLDIHEIPSSDGSPSHFHYDIRYLVISKDEDLSGNEESTEVKWIEKNSTGYHRGLQKMIDKWSR